MAKATKVETAKISKSQEVRVLRRIVEITNSALDLDFVLKEIVGIVSEFTGADSVFIYLFDEFKENLILKASKTPHKKDLGHIILKKGEGLTGWVAQEKKPVFIKKHAFKDDRFKAFTTLPEDKFEAFLGVPIMYENKIIGVINTQHKKPHTYTQTIVNLIAMIAKQVAGVIEQARLYLDTKLKALQFDCFMRVGESITSEKYLDEILESIAEISAEMLNSKICSIMLLDAKEDSLIMKAAKGFGKSGAFSHHYREKPPVKVNNSLSGEVILSKKPRAVLDVTKESKYFYRKLAVQTGLSSLLLVPMIVKDSAIGIVNVYTKTFHEFSKEEITALQIIANQAAVTIENTRLTQEGEKAKEALQTRKLVERAKGLLMKAQLMSEDDAYKLIRKKSMDSCRTMKEIAEAVILTSDLS